MLITPRVFVSAVSSDLQSARQVVCRALNELECLPVEQCHLGTQYGPVREMLRNQIASCQAVIHIVGRDYGGEPVPHGNPRRSWTQLEYDLALELQRKLYVIVCSQKYSFDPVPQPEPAAKAALQAQHYHQVLGGKHLWHRVNAPSDLRDCVLRLKLPLDEVRTALRRQQSRQRLLIGAGAAAVVLALGRLGATVEDAAVRVKQSVEHTGANVQQVIEETQRQSGAKLDRQSEQLLLVELGLQALDEATRELTATLDGQSSLSEVGFLSARVDDLLSDVDENLVSQSIPAPGVRVIRDAKAASLRATMRLEHYPINPPDVLLIEGVHLIPRGPQVVRKGHQLFVDSTDPRLRDVVLTVGADGALTLPDQMGSVSIGGLSISEAEKAVAKLLDDTVVDPIVIIQLADPHQFQQPIFGEHLVAPDGRVTLGVYGQVFVAGMSVPAARAAIEEHLSEFFEEPLVAVSVGGYNSMVFYVVFESEGKSIVRPMPYFGHQSVMSAIAMLGGPPGPVIRARLTNPKLPRLEVDWPAILDGDFSTDYRLCPDDRIVLTLKSADGIHFSEGTDVTADAAFDQNQSPSTPERRPSTSPYLNLLKD